MLQTISDGALRIARLILHGGESLGPAWLFTLFALAALSALAGPRAARFANPARPYASALARLAGALFAATGMAALVILLFLVAVLLISVVVAFSAVVAPEHWTAASMRGLQVLWRDARTLLSSAIAGTVIGACVAVYVRWHGIPSLERGDGLADIRNVVGKLKRRRRFNPSKHIDIARGLFLGIGDRGPVYVTWPKWRAGHCQVIGIPGSGKGVSIGLMSYQSTLAGEAVFVFDPKQDSKLPGVLATAARDSGRAMKVLDLRPEAPPQFDPLAGASVSEIEEMLVAGLGLADRGGEGDYYRGIDRDAAGLASRLAREKKALSLSELVAVLAGEESVMAADNFWRQLRAVAELSATHSLADLDLPGVIERGEILYVVGSSSNERTKTLQRMVLMRIFQVIKRRNRSASMRPVALVLDEFKHLISPVAVHALAEVRDFGCHIVIAHQSMGDLYTMPGADPTAIRSEVMDTTPIKLVFKIQDPNFAKELSNLAGRRRTFTEQAGVIDREGRKHDAWREQQVNLIDAELLTHLPVPADAPDSASLGVLFGIGAAQMIAMSPIQASERAPSAVSAPMPKERKSSEANSLI